MPTFKKDPHATLDYQFDWTDFLTPVGDTIASVEWIVTGSLVVESFSNTGLTATAFVSGGTLGGNETLTCRITTTNVGEPRIDDRSATLKIVNR